MVSSPLRSWLLHATRRALDDLHGFGPTVLEQRPKVYSSSFQALIFASIEFLRLHELAVEHADSLWLQTFVPSEFDAEKSKLKVWLSGRTSRSPVLSRVFP